MSNQPNLKMYTEGMSLLHQSGILEYLKELARPAIAAPHGENYVEHQNALANQSIGYFRAIDDLIFFREKYLDSKEPPKMSVEFGGLERALQSGDLTIEEVNAIRNTGKPEPSK